MTTYTARYVFPVTGPPLTGGTVSVTGDRITAVEPAGVRAPDVDLGNSAVIPGLVNAHTHLDLSGARGRIPPTDPDHFTDWLLGVIAYRRGRTPDEVQADIRAGLAEAMRFGTTLLGDIAAGGASWDAVTGAAVRAVVFYELIGLSKERADAALAAGAVWYRATTDTSQCLRGVSPHAPYSANAELLTAGSADRFRTAIHLAETLGEFQLVRSHAGPFVPFLTAVGAWEPSGLVRQLDLVITRNRPAGRALFIHGNYLSPDVARYFHADMSIVYCPRTHAAFGHPPHPFREFLARGVRVCLGTDSLASNPDLDPLAEARFVRTRHPDLPPDQLLRMVTLSGAESLGWADECGSLEPGKSADFVAVPLPDADAADPHDLLLSDHPGPRRTLFRGAWRA